MSIPDTEREMVWEAIKTLANQDIEVAIEVPFLSRSIDLVYSDQEGKLTAIEFKRHDWRRALQQARDHRLGTERVYVCLPEPIINDNVLQEAKGLGVGVLAWSSRDPLETYLQPEPSSLPLPSVNDWLVSAFRVRKAEGARL